MAENDAEGGCSRRKVLVAGAGTALGASVLVSGKELQCPCHGSTFDLVTGDNTGGPAPRPLAKVPVEVRKGEVVEA